MEVIQHQPKTTLVLKPVSTNTQQENNRTIQLVLSAFGGETNGTI